MSARSLKKGFLVKLKKYLKRVVLYKLKRGFLPKSFSLMQEIDKNLRASYNKCLRFRFYFGLSKELAKKVFLSPTKKISHRVFFG